MTAPILVIDDDTVVRRMICQALEDDGLATISAPNTRAAIEQAAESHPRLVVLDVTLPLDGGSVAAQLRSAFGDHFPILVITAANNAADQARLMGAYTYLQKPFDVDDLVNHIRRGLQ